MVEQRTENPRVGGSILPRPPVCSRTNRPWHGFHRPFTASGTGQKSARPAPRAVGRVGARHGAAVRKPGATRARAYRSVVPQRVVASVAKRRLASLLATAEVHGARFLRRLCKRFEARVLARAIAEGLPRTATTGTPVVGLSCFDFGGIRALLGDDRLRCHEASPFGWNADVSRRTCGRHAGTRLRLSLAGG